MAFKPKNDKISSVSSLLKDAQIKVLSQDDYRNYHVEIEIMRSGWNENDWNYQNVADYAKTFAFTPILIAYIPKKMLKDGIGDGHNAETKIDPKTGEKYRSFIGATSERAVGYITDNIRTEFRDGETWVIAEGIIWEQYNKELVDKLRRTGRMGVSAETNVGDIEKVQQGEIFHSWEALGVTILGDGVAPAVPNANVQAFKKATEKVMQVRVAQQNKKGATQKMTKSQLKELQAKFPNHKVIAANGENVVLLNERLEASMYTFSSEDMGTIDMNRMLSAEMTLTTKCGEEIVELEWEKTMADMIHNTEKLSKENDELSSKCTEMESKISEMEKAMLERNRNDYQEAAKARLQEINENRAADEEVPDDEIEDVVEDAKTMEFEENADIKEMASKAVDTKVMAFIMKLDKQKADARENSKTDRFSFEGAFNQRSSGNSIQDAFNRLKGQ